MRAICVRMSCCCWLADLVEAKVDLFEEKLRRLLAKEREKDMIEDGDGRSTTQNRRPGQSQSSRNSFKSKFRREIHPQIKVL